MAVNGLTSLIHLTCRSKILQLIEFRNFNFNSSFCQYSVSFALYHLQRNCFLCKSVAAVMLCSGHCNDYVLTKYCFSIRCDILYL